MTGNPLHVVTDSTPGVHPVEQLHELRWWLPVLGPTATILAHRLALTVPAGVGSTFELLDLAGQLGIGRNLSKVTSVLNRLDRFGAGHFHAADVFSIRVSLPLIPDRLIAMSLPPSMAEEYRRLHHLPTTTQETPPCPQPSKP